MAGLTNHDTQRLTRASVELVAGQERRRGLLATACAVVLVLAGSVAIRYEQGPLGMPLRLVNLREENARLQAELERARLEAEMERATRAELERQIEALGDQVTELNQQLEFVNSRTTRQSASLRPAKPVAVRQEG